MKRLRLRLGWPGRDCLCSAAGRDVDGPGSSEEQRRSKSSSLKVKEKSSSSVIGASSWLSRSRGTIAARI
jgi:hypothetical protein